MPAYRLLPACKDHIWGGQRLRTDYGIPSGLDPLSEAWVLSCHPDGPSVLADGPYQGLTLPEYIQRAGPQVLGTRCRRFEYFPMLVKLIDAKQDLSIQVHPFDEYALAHEGQYGKTEMWVVLDAAPDAYLYHGLRREVGREELAQRIEQGALTGILRKRFVSRGDVIFIPSGTLHAIGAGLVVAEVQQNSNVTYRVFDYGRIGADGKPRPLHIKKALDVIDLHPTAERGFGPHLGSCRWFTTDLRTGTYDGACGETSFHAVLITQGSGTLTVDGASRAVKKGECYFLCAGSGAYRLDGRCEYLVIYV